MKVCPVPSWSLVSAVPLPDDNNRTKLGPCIIHGDIGVLSRMRKVVTRDFHRTKLGTRTNAGLRKYLAM